MAGPEAEGRGRRREVASELCLYLGLDHRGLVLVSLGSSLLVLADSCSQGPISALSRCSHLLLYGSLHPGCRRLRNPAGV